MAIYIRAIGKMGKPMVLESLWILKEVCIWASGLMINNTVKELNLGITIISNTLVSFQMERRLDKVGLNLKVGIMKVILKTENLKAKASITFLILESSTKATSKKTTWMEKALWFGLTALDTTAISNPAK